MAYSPEQYQASKERIKAAQKRYYQRTREARLSYQKDNGDKNRDQIRARTSFRYEGSFRTSKPVRSNRR
ncbi:hypothetical protein PHYSODRAFT_520637 [Phytophthora sojae]|uniref:Uncharacterized protein n=1 Tax=Phytophthora sojae (strain P6497) TaxID=1094619 RepID=G4ZZA7_PHYSP|nr:hypothetical protein PHYSODRAFT_520637 [Phytophthora sojae]EGZ11129.1 hypothetical protein PHYSODRAFT_520637 [Phytophthora sojae]|eukprot:XP_009533874.1 hypothetical protein PHYSODRAFT_520637 [Phytophthora sojae]